MLLSLTLQAVDTGNLPFYLDLKKIYFNGTKERWDSIVDKDFASSYNKTTVYFYSEVQPENSGNYWCYKDGIITVW